jgi:hypothetical protein
MEKKMFQTTNQVISHDIPMIFTISWSIPQIFIRGCLAGHGPQLLKLELSWMGPGFSASRFDLLDSKPRDLGTVFHRSSMFWLIDFI